MLDKTALTQTLGLSCVEKYFAAWLSRFTDITKLYGGAFVGIARVFDDFSNGATYENYCRLPRIQDIAEKYGMVSHEYIPCSATDAKKRLKKAKENDLCLMRVNTAFFTDFKRSSWREDHYVCVNGDLEWINEYPLSAGKFTEERFKEVYDGALCLYAIADISAEIPDGVTKAFAAQDCAVHRFPPGLDSLESAIGVLRVTRKRLQKFYRKNEKAANALGEEIALMDKLFFDIRLRQLKEKKGERSDRQKAYAELCARVQAVADAEKKATEILRK